MTRASLARVALPAMAAVAVTIAPSVLTSGPPAGAATAPSVQTACASTHPGWARCLALYRTVLRPADTAQPAGYGPADLRSAYEYPATGGAGQTVAIVDAYDDPNAEADLAGYRAQYGLAPCTTANGCFAKVDQRGEAGALPAPNYGWAVEISLDLDMVSAACPACHILLVEADDPSLPNLAGAVDTAVRLGATEVSNSYGAPEDQVANVRSFRAHYRHPGVPIVASSGDTGFGPAQVPAAYSSVIAVGGTSLTRADNARGWTEHAWSNAGSGCSAWIDKPSWQHDRNCHMRTVADVSADADPATGVAVHDTYLTPGWLVVGGTSASAPFIAAGIALAGNAAKIDDAAPLYHRRSAFNDVIGGTTSGPSCGGDYLCTAVTGYDGPTGLGSPAGVAGL